MSPALVVLILALLLGLQPVTTDLYLPALPGLTAGFGAPVTQAQLTLTALLLAFGCSQLVWGPLSDRYGRRPILVAGLALYVLTAIGSVLAPSMEWLIVLRALQGAAMGAAVMGARAIVRDLHAPAEGARVMSRALSGLGVIAMLAAPLGALATGWGGWRGALALLAVFGGAAWLVVVMRFRETLAQPDPLALAPALLARRWRGILSHPAFAAYSAISIASYAGLFTFLASSSFVFIDVLGLSRFAYGAVMFTMAGVYFLGTLLCRRLLARHGLQRTLAIGGGIALVGGTLLGGLWLADVRGTAALLAPFCIFMLAHGVNQPCSQAGCVGPFPRAAGAASAMNGFLMMLAAFAVGSWVGWRYDGTEAVLVTGVWFWSAAVAIASWTLVRRWGGEAVAATPAAPEAARV